MQSIQLKQRLPWQRSSVQFLGMCNHFWKVCNNLNFDFQVLTISLLILSFSILSVSFFCSRSVLVCQLATALVSFWVLPDTERWYSLKSLACWRILLRYSWKKSHKTCWSKNNILTTLARQKNTIKAPLSLSVLVYLMVDGIIESLMILPCKPSAMLLRFVLTADVRCQETDYGCLFLSQLF